MKSFAGIVLLAVAALAAGLGLDLLLLVTWLHASSHHAVVALQYLLLSGAVSLGAGLAAVLLAVRFAPSLGLKIGLAGLFGSLAATINVAVTPLLMFSQRADKILLIVTLLYFAIISVALAAAVGFATTGPIQALREGARRLTRGEFDARVPVQGRDEVADLGRAFNRMSAELGESFARERRMEAERRELFAAVSHDLRTPLASLRVLVEALGDGVVSEPRQVERYLGLIRRETEHLGTLIDDLFELARLEAGRLELHLAPVPLAELVRETVESLQVQAEGRGVTLAVHADDTLPAMAVDAPRMQRVLVNLIDNALQHTPAGGRVDVAVSAADGQVEVAVIDTGEGITPEDRPHIFKRHYRGDRARTRAGDRGGAGLGLAIARAIVEAHGGSISVEEPEEAGARFVVTLASPPLSPQRNTSP